MSRYQLFIDDSGTKDYAAAPGNYNPRGNTRYFCFGAVLVEQAIGSRLAAAIAGIKVTAFGSPNVEIKSNWLRIPKEREAHYLAPFDLSDAKLTEFVDLYYDLVGEAEVMIVAAVVDKIHMQEDYPPPRTPWYPPAYAYEAILQRVVQEIHLPGTVGVVVDDMSGATPKGNQYKKNLVAHHAKLRAHGSSLQKGLKFGVLEAPMRFVNSASSHLVQVADIVAYNVYRQFVDHGDEWEIARQTTLTTYPWFRRIGPKFRKDTSGRIQGYGVIKLPLRKQVRWGLYRGQSKTAP